MAWTSPRTWTTGELVTAALMNTHLRDNLKAIGDPWTAYTPVLTASTTNPTLGSGSVATGRYLKAGRDVRGTFDITFGSSGVAAGSGTYRISVPTNIYSSWPSRAPVGRAYVFDSSGSASGWFDLMSDYTHFRIRYPSTWPTGTATEVGAAVPWTWAAGDIIRGSFCYEAQS